MKASEVFDLPVSVGEYNMDNDNIYSASSEWCATLFSDEQAKVAANCINHADALADALESMLEHEKEMTYSVWNYSEDGASTFEESEEFARFKDSFAEEIEALSNYRG